MLHLYNFNSYKQKLFGLLNIFKSVKWFQDPKIWEPQQWSISLLVSLGGNKVCYSLAANTLKIEMK